MPKLALHQVGDIEDRECSAPGCKKGARASGSTGYALPFCLPHLEALPARTYSALERMASASVYDRAAVAEAWRLLERAKRALARTGKR